MGKIHYELGVRTRASRSLVKVLVRWQVAVAIVVVTVAGFAVGQYGITHSSELDHRQNRMRYSGSQQSLRRSAWLHVRPAVSLAPTASPSVVADTNGQATTVPAAPAVASVVTAADDVTASAPATVADPVDASMPADTSATTPPEPMPIPVVAAAARPAITVSVDIPRLPVISLPVPSTASLDNPAKKDIAMQLVSSAENSSLNWKDQYAYIEDIKDGRGYTAGIIGFCSGTGDMLELVRYYTKLEPDNPLASYLPALEKVNGSESHSGLDAGFTAAWKAAANDPKFQQAQNDERDRVYFNPAVSQAKSDGLRALGQFMYYDAIVMHGPGNDPTSFGGIRAAAIKHAKTPAQGGNEKTYLNAFLDARVVAMKTEAAHDDVDRVQTEQRLFLQAGNFDLNTPLTWSVYGDSYKIQ